ncbi:phosphosulfolactate synthase [Paenibacillus sp. GCM10027626]|uniref:phosphosulfolactate synthase n=1 Tax=Paenibacillus sp. GCM10027626 TaxID=3273411 RepID=UPI00363261D2
MSGNLQQVWPLELIDPSGERANRRTSSTFGQTMVIDKFLGRNGFTDLLETAAPYISCIKIGFGTAPLYPTELLLFKINLAKQYGTTVMAGGTLLEAAVQQNKVTAFFDAICQLGFNGVEVSDGTIQLKEQLRDELIREGVRRGLKVVSEYGKKLSNSLLDATDFALRAEADLEAGSSLVTVEARESGCGGGLFNERGECNEGILDSISHVVEDQSKIMWEAPLKHQQVLLLQRFGSNVNLGNIAPADILSLETLRRGLRSDTFSFGLQQGRTQEQEDSGEESAFLYMI